MDDLFAMSMAWWQFVLRGAVAYLALLILMRLTGKRAFSDMSPFDVVVLIIVGGTLRSAIVGRDASLLGPLLAVTTILILDKLLAHTAARSERVCRLLEGTPLLLASAGAVFSKALRRAGIPQAAVARELRLHEVRSIAEVEEMRLEPNGKISVLKRQR